MHQNLYLLSKNSALKWRIAFQSLTGTVSDMQAAMRTCLLEKQNEMANDPVLTSLDLLVTTEYVERRAVATYCFNRLEKASRRSRFVFTTPRSAPHGRRRSIMRKPLFVRCFRRFTLPLFLFSPFRYISSEKTSARVHKIGRHAENQSRSSRTIMAYWR